MTTQQLIAKAKRLHISLERAIKEGRKESPTYWVVYKKWFVLREEGLRRKLFPFFVPSKGDAE